MLAPVLPAPVFNILNYILNLFYHSFFASLSKALHFSALLKQSFSFPVPFLHCFSSISSNFCCFFQGYGFCTG